MYLLLIGLVFMVLGFLGLFFGNLIKAAVSRQREFLADASAVQFTRNPEGIAGALKRIGAAVFGSKLVSPRAAEASHMYFAEGLSEHVCHASAARRAHSPHRSAMGRQVSAGAAGGRRRRHRGRRGGRIRRASDGDRCLRQARAGGSRRACRRASCQSDARFTASTCTSWSPRCRRPWSMRPTIRTAPGRSSSPRCSIAMPTFAPTQLRALEQIADPNVFELTLQLVPAVNQLDVRARLPLVDMTLPALRAMSPSQYQRVHAVLRAAGARPTSGWACSNGRCTRSCCGTCGRNSSRCGRRMTVYYGLQQLGGAVLGVALGAGAGQPAATIRWRSRPARGTCPKCRSSCCRRRRAACRSSTRRSTNWPRRRRSSGSGWSTPVRPASVPMREVNVGEGELLRAVCDMLDCPMPPLLPGQEVSPSMFAAARASQQRDDCACNRRRFRRRIDFAPRCDRSPRSNQRRALLCASLRRRSSTHREISSKSKRRCWPRKSFPSCTSSRSAAERLARRSCKPRPSCT